MAEAKKAPSTFTEIKMSDGSIVKMTLNFARLLMLKSKNQAAYDAYTSAINEAFVNDSSMPSEFGCIDVLYAGYLCSDVEHTDELMTYEQFCELLPLNHSLVYSTFSDLYQGNEGKK